MREQAGAGGAGVQCVKHVGMLRGRRGQGVSMAGGRDYGTCSGRLEWVGGDSWQVHVNC